MLGVVAGGVAIAWTNELARATVGRKFLCIIYESVCVCVCVCVCVRACVRACV